MFKPRGSPRAVRLISMLDCQGIKLLLYMLIECFDRSLVFAIWHASKTLHNIEELLILLLQLSLSLSPPRTPDELTDRKRSRGKLFENQQVNLLGFAHRFC